MTACEEGLALIQQHERLVEELDVQLGLRIPITASGAVMTLPASTMDLKDWMADERKFLSVQYDDWMQVVGDFRQSLAESGPKLVKLVDPMTTPIGRLLQRLFSSTVEPGGTRTYTIDAAVRAAILRRVEQLDAELATEAAIIAAWRDLVSCCDKPNRTVEQVSFRRDTLWAIAQRRDLDVRRFGIFWHVSAVLTDDADAVQREVDRAAGVKHEPTGQPSGRETWERLKLCEQVLARPPERGDCIVWLRLAPTSLPQYEVTHGQVTFYNAAYLSGFVGYPELADRFDVPPAEILNPPEIPPILRDGEVEWENDWNMAYARVVLPDTEIHAAEAKARTLVEALKAVNHATKDTWGILNGSIFFINGRRHSPMSWGPKEDLPEPYYSQNDWMGRDIAQMSGSKQALDSQSMRVLQDAIGMSSTLKSALDMSPQAAVMAAVRAIEHVNVWTTGGAKNWADFASEYFKKAQARIKVVEFISRYARTAIENLPDRRPSTPPQPLGGLCGSRTQLFARASELSELRTKLRVFEWPHEFFNVRAAADRIPMQKRIYTDHWLVRELGELETILATPDGMYAGLTEQGRRFDRQLGRLKRLHNSAIHGGPVSDAACASVAVFAKNLGHQCLNEAMRALMIGHDIPSHMADYRADHIDRYDRVRTKGDIDALFVEP